MKFCLSENVEVTPGKLTALPVGEKPKIVISNVQTIVYAGETCISFLEYVQATMKAILADRHRQWINQQEYTGRGRAISKCNNNGKRTLQWWKTVCTA